MRVLSTADLHFHVNRSDGETSAFSSASTSRSPRLRDFHYLKLQQTPPSPVGPG
jgi:hypothetical protein